MVLKGSKKEGEQFEFEKGFLSKLNTLPEGVFEIRIELKNNELEKLKKHYFAQVDKLAHHLGYCSKSDKDLFKEQLNHHFKSGISEIKSTDEMKVRLEELHQLASIQFNYLFEPYIQT